MNAAVSPDIKCTIYPAISCPRCGECTCDKIKLAHPCFDKPDCPLHGLTSKHAPEGLIEGERVVREMEFVHGKPLTAHDRNVVVRFAQMLHEKPPKETR